jgi:hypothetical protein
MRNELNIPNLTDPEYAYLNTIIAKSADQFLVKVSPVNLQAIARGILTTEKIVMDLADHFVHSSEGKRSGMLCIARRGYHATSPLLVEIGQVNGLDNSVWNEKRNKYAFYALAKAVVLGQHPTFLRSEENTSLKKGKIFIRRDLTDENGKHLKEQPAVPSGGIALENGFVFTYSCYKDGMLDEAVAMGAAYASSLASTYELDMIGKKTNNVYWRAIIKENVTQLLEDSNPASDSNPFAVIDLDK